MYGLRAVRGVIGVGCPELRGIRFSEVCNDGIFNRSFFSVRFSEGPL